MGVWQIGFASLCKPRMKRARQAPPALKARDEIALNIHNLSTQYMRLRCQGYAQDNADVAPIAEPVKFGN